MPLPGGLNAVTITSNLLDAAGLPLQGVVTLIPVAALTAGANPVPVNVVDASGSTVIAPQGVTRQVVNGAISSLTVVATDNAGLSPSPWYYQVSLYAGSAPPDIFVCSLPHSPSTVDFSALVPATVGQALNAYLPLAGGTETGTVYFTGSPALQVPSGGASGKVLTSDASGNASWQSASAGMSNPMTAAGDLIDGGTSGTPQRLAVGSTGQVLTVSGGTLAWAALPAVPAIAVKASGDTTGVTDAAAISAACAAASSAGGALVQLGPGTFWVNAAVAVPAGVSVAGTGRSLTTVKIAAGASGFNVFTAASVSGVAWRDMTIDLNKAGTSNGGNSLLQMGIEVLATGATVTGIEIRRVTVQNGWQQGIALNNGAVMANTITAVLEDVTVTSMGNIGILLYGGLNCVFSRPACSGCGTGSGFSGIEVQGSAGTKILSPACTGNTAHGIAFNFGSYNTPCTGFQVTGGDCSSNNAGGSSGYGIVASEGSSDFEITGVRCEGNGAGGIGIDTAWDASRVTGTATSGTTTTLTDSTAAWPVNTWAGWTVRFTSGTGSGQSSVITSNTATALTFGTVTTAPDATTHYAVDGSHIFTDAGGAISGCVCASNHVNGIWVDYVTNLTITGCEIHHNGTYGVSMVARYCVVSACDIHDNTLYGINIGNSGLGDTGGGHLIGPNLYLNNGSGTVTDTGSIASSYVSLPLPVASGGTGDASLTAYAPLTGGATSTGAVQQATTGLGTSGNVLTSTGSSSLPTWQTPASGGMTNPMTAAGDLIDGGTAGAAQRLAGNTSATKEFLTSTGTGSAANTPAWGTIAAGDLPAATSGAQGAVQLAGDLGNTAASPQVVSTHLSSALPVAQGGTGSTTRNFAGLLTPVAVKTTTYAAVAGDFVPCDTTSGSFTVTLPNAPADLSVVEIKQVIQGGTNTVTVACAGSDVFNKTAGSTSGTLTLLAQGMLLQYKASGAIWYVLSDDLPLTQLDTRYLHDANNLSDLASAGTARTNLGLGTGATANIDATATDIAALGSQSAGATGKLADAGHVHPTTGVVLTSSLPLAIGSGGTGQTAKGAAFNALSPNAALGDLTYGSGTNTSTNLAGNTTATKNFLAQTGTGSVSAAPAWGAIASADMPTGTTSAKGALQLDGTTGDIQASPGTAAAGASGEAADAKHVHPQPPVFAPTGLTGATAAARFAGATTSGAPASGTFATGDFVIDQTGAVWVCTTAGTPGTWVAIGGATPVGKQAAYSAITANITPTITASYSALAGAPSITLPNDSHTYRVDLFIPYAAVSVAGVVTIAIATGTAGILNASQQDMVLAARQYNYYVTAQSVTGSGQTVTVYAVNSAGSSTLTITAAAGGASGTGPCELAAYRVA